MMTQSNTNKNKIAICVTVKNEAPYLLEWIAYHRSIGIHHFLIYENESTDNTLELLEDLEKSDIVTCIKWQTQPNTNIQRLAYIDAVERLRGKFEWVAFIDADEFIVLKNHDNIESFLSAYDDVAGIAVNWKLFGSSGHVEKTNDLVIERFKKCAVSNHKKHYCVKTLAKVDLIRKIQIHTCGFPDSALYVYPDRTLYPQEMGGRGSHITHNDIQINHYCTKSRSEWELKISRGRATGREDWPEYHFNEHDRNEEEDYTILNFLEKTKHEIEFLSKLCQKKSSDLEIEEEPKKSEISLINSSKILSWEAALNQNPIRLYIGNLARQSPNIKDRWIGISRSKSDEYHIKHDWTKPFPISDGIIDALLCEDIFQRISPDNLLSRVFPELYRILKPGGYLRISVPDYRCDILLERSWKDDRGKPYFDPKGGGIWNAEAKEVHRGGHVWFPTYERLKALVELSTLGYCQVQWLHYYDENGKPIINPIDYSKGFIQRTPDNDRRVKGTQRPLSIVVDLYKEERQFLIQASSSELQPSFPKKEIVRESAKINTQHSTVEPSEINSISIGDRYAHRQQWQQAIKAYKTAFKLEQNLNENAYIKLRYAQIQGGDLKGANETYQQMLLRRYVVNQKYKIIYCPIPKNACTLFRTIMVKHSDAGEKYEKSQHDIHKYLVQNDTGVKLNDFLELKKSEYFKFVVLRNPFDRLVSAYLDKIAKRHKLAPFVRDVVESVYNSLDQEPDYRRSITFSQFVHYLVKTEDYSLNEHWRPQHTFLGEGMIEFDLIGQFEKLDLVIESLENKFGFPLETQVSNHITNYDNDDRHNLERFNDAYPKQLRSLEAFPKACQFYTPELEQLIRDRYTKDFEIYERQFETKIRIN
jgi:SAM-dependent methyltransferase